MSGGSHLGRVRALYKAVLKLHCGLPMQMKALGDQYVKEEFRRHKEAKAEEVDMFMHEWTKYYVTLAKQLAKRRKTQDIGENLSPQMMDNLNQEQLGQLHELFKETIENGQNQTTDSGSSKS